MKIVIQGQRTNCVTGKMKHVRLVLEDYWSPGVAGYEGAWWVRIAEGGVTGYESCEVERLLTGKTGLNGWCACAGTKMSWDKLEISGLEMRMVTDALRKEYVTKESRSLDNDLS